MNNSFTVDKRQFERGNSKMDINTNKSFTVDKRHFEGENSNMDIHDIIEARMARLKTMYAVKKPKSPRNFSGHVRRKRNILRYYDDLDDALFQIDYLVKKGVKFKVLNKRSYDKVLTRYGEDPKEYDFWSLKIKMDFEEMVGYVYFTPLSKL